MKRASISYQFQKYEDFLDIWTEIKKQLEDVLVAEKLLFEVAILEAVNNAFKHGNRMVKGKSITILVRIFAHNKVMVRVKDEGPGFPVRRTLTQYCKELDVEKVLDDAGRGIYLMLQTADLVKYNREGNEVLLVCNLTKTGVS